MGLIRRGSRHASMEEMRRWTDLGRRMGQTPMPPEFIRAAREGLRPGPIMRLFGRTSPAEQAFAAGVAEGERMRRALTS